MGSFLGLTCRVVRFGCGKYPTGLVSGWFVYGTHVGLEVCLRHTRRAGRFFYGTHVGLGGLSAAHTQGLRFVYGTHVGLGGLSAAHTQGWEVCLRHTRRAGRFVYGTHVGMV